MAGRRKKRGGDDLSEAKTKLSRLLDTENELETMLKETRREAEELVEAARRNADERLRAFDAELETGDGEVHRRILRERDESIQTIQAHAREIEERLDGLGERRIDELAEHLISLIVGQADRGGPT